MSFFTRVVYVRADQVGGGVEDPPCFNIGYSEPRAEKGLPPPYKAWANFCSILIG